MRKTGSLSQLFTAVLVSDKPFDMQSNHYVPAGENDQFSFYHSTRLEPINNRIVYQVIAADSLRYFNYVHIYEPSHFKGVDSTYHTNLALNDVKEHFKKKK
ncbi:MAG TPA: hypothetical protein VD794_00615 [Flavisolibacter sp.]|nr:hypothetical protein [Flavisolibacter sp.]